LSLPLSSVAESLIDLLIVTASGIVWHPFYDRQIGSEIGQIYHLSYDRPIGNEIVLTCYLSYDQRIGNGIVPTCYPSFDQQIASEIVQTCYPSYDQQIRSETARPCYPSYDQQIESETVRTCYPSYDQRIGSVIACLSSHRRIANENATRPCFASSRPCLYPFSTWCASLTLAFCASSSAIGIDDACSIASARFVALCESQSVYDRCNDDHGNASESTIANHCDRATSLS